jgi:diguanylate cyclase (GGDEF)-like protein
MVMIDSDGLKEINDKYGHEKGDIYLKKTGEALKQIGSRKSVAARQGGDEFVVFLYEYETEKELLNVIKDLEDTQKNTVAKIDEDFTVEVKFSFGYEVEKNPKDYKLMLKAADERMYENKRLRKGKV